MTTTGETGGLSSEARARFEEELALLREQRAALGIDEGTGGGLETGDRADNAEALLRLDEATHLDERITEIVRLLHGAPPRGEVRDDDALPPGTVVTLRYDDGSVEEMRAVAITEDVPAGAEDASLTLDSPLGQALAGHRAGDTISWDTPDGRLSAEVVSIKSPT